MATKKKQEPEAEVPVEAEANNRKRSVFILSESYKDDWPEIAGVRQELRGGVSRHA